LDAGVEQKIQPKGTSKQVIVAALVAAVVGALIARFKLATVPIKNWPVLVSILGLVAFNIYWTVAATHAPAKAAESRGSRRIHEVLLNAGYLLILLPEFFTFAVPRFVAAGPIPAALGLAAQAGGFALAVWARRRLGQNWSGRIEIKMDHQLVRTGPYRLLRHPIYTAVVSMALGMAIVVGKVSALLGVVVIVIAYVRKIRLEETNMRSAFGAEYDAYCRDTWGLVPGIF
jgi:protein-S-isoprenylcysteine O-methyltransferase Ste14